jgi:hypothetical protein
VDRRGGRRGARLLGARQSEEVGLTRPAIHLLPAVFAWTRAGCGRSTGVNSPRPAESAAPQSSPEELQSSLAEAHEKSVETAKEAAGAVKEGAESTAAGAEEAVTNPDETAKQAAEATKEKSKQVALSFKDDMYHFPWRLWDDFREIPSWRSAIVLGAGAALAGISTVWWDDKVREEVSDDPERFGHVENNTLSRRIRKCCSPPRAFSTAAASSSTAPSS